MAETPSQILRDLADALDEDNELDMDDKAAIAGAAAAALGQRQAMKRIGQSAHVHKKLHVEDDAVCHDCRRELISDAGTERILVCPQIHGKRPLGLRPAHTDHAVECGLEA